MLAPACTHAHTHATNTHTYARNRGKANMPTKNEINIECIDIAELRLVSGASYEVLNLIVSTVLMGEVDGDKSD